MATSSDTPNSVTRTFRLSRQCAAAGPASSRPTVSQNPYQLRNAGVTVTGLASRGPLGMEVDVPLHDYGVLAGRVVDTRREGSADTPHYQIRLADGAGTPYRAAINLLSQQSPSELLYLVNDDFRHP